MSTSLMEPTIASELGVEGYFRQCEVVLGAVAPEILGQLMLEQISSHSPDRAEKCAICPVFDLMRRVPVVPALRNGTSSRIRRQMDEGIAACSDHNGRVRCCRAVQAYNEGLSGSATNRKHALVFRP